jgi:hypothetical protein
MRLIARPEPARIILRWLASESEVEAALAEIEGNEEKE